MFILNRMCKIYTFTGEENVSLVSPNLCKDLCYIPFVYVTYQFTFI